MSDPSRITFDTFGDESKASSRLRAWMIIDELRRRGVEVEANGRIGSSEVHVFQKRWTAERAREARERGALVVYDFDDNYLMEDHGTRRDTLMRMNAADLVSVGSPAMFEAVSRLHDRPFLLENPLDVAEDARIKQRYEGTERLVWFGAPENRDALEELQLDRPVTEITSGGDIEWRLETIDRNLVSFDLALIPVELDEWTATKNANRLLKCVALGVPPLSARTPEHERIADLIGLPDWLLVEENGDWNLAIEGVRGHLKDLDDVMRSARTSARRIWGIEAVVDRWLANIRMLPRARPAPYPIDDVVREQARELDVVVLKTNTGQFVERTLEGLKLDDLEYRSVALLTTVELGVVLDDTGLPVRAGDPPEVSEDVDVFIAKEDHFELYSELARRVCVGGATIVLRAGATITRGFFDHLRALDCAGRVTVARTQLDFPRLELSDPPPDRLDELLLEPVGWDCVILPEPGEWSDGLDPIVLDLMLWDVLIGEGERGYGWEVMDLPAVLDDPRVEPIDPALDFARWLQLTRPEIAGDYPPREAESSRLRRTLHARVVERHRPTFQAYASTLLPSLAARTDGRATTRSSTNRDVSTARIWLERLSATTYEESPHLIRHENGAVDLIDGGLRRPVRSGLIAAALEQIFGPREAVADDHPAAQLREGPPASVFVDGSGRLYFIAGGRRYPVVGMPVPVPADGDDLGLFRRVDTEDVNLATANAPVTHRRSVRHTDPSNRDLLSVLPDSPGTRPELVRLPDGSVFLVDNGFARTVSSSYVAGGLEMLYGNIRDVDSLPESVDSGPPAAVLQDRSGKLHFVANGLRRPVHGLPVPLRVDRDELERFEPTQEKLDLARGSVPASRIGHEGTRRDVASVRSWLARVLRQEDK